MDLDELSRVSNSIRFLSVDMIERANSGHPGVAMGLSDIMAYFSTVVNITPKDSRWINRDRVVFSGGHASSMIYSFYHLMGYDISLDDLKNFRQFGSNTAGHPEYGHVDGVEITTGPLGQGVANAVGFAMAQKYMQNVVNIDKTIIDHKVYCFCGDGDLEEGISYEASSLASLYNLNNLILIFDSNKITIEGSTALSTNEDIKARFSAQNFNVIEIDGHNYNDIAQAFSNAQKSSKPVLIIANTKIGRGSATQEGSSHIHGAPLGSEDTKLSKEKAGVSSDTFVITDDVRDFFARQQQRTDKLYTSYKELLSSDSKSKEALDNLNRFDTTKIIYPEFKVGELVATRSSNHKILNAVAKAIPAFMGGSADLSPSNKSNIVSEARFPNGRNISYGIREHAMGAINNAIALYGPFLPYSATFFVFSDYLKPAVRIASLSKIKQLYIWTHDSIGVGEDGPTHQPIEHLTQFRALPNLEVYRPADAVENVECMKMALKSSNPSAFVLSRQNLEVFSRESVSGDITKGGYLVQHSKDATITILATGSEVNLALNIAATLKDKEINVVSIPCYDIFINQPSSYINSIIKKDTKVVAIEAGRGIEWYRFTRHIISMDSFGASGKASDLFEYFGFTTKNIINKFLQ